LRLQLEFDRIDQQHLETLADEQLRYYNKILRQQADELSDELSGLQNQLAAMLGKSRMPVTSALGLDFTFNNDVRELKKTVKALRKDVKSLTDPVVLKAWLKSYRIQKADDFGASVAFFG
ncbi:hypothetical protein, partial [Staphylococcus aureus]|uniref:hypothetical protein n=1 Tax=Staphylococcus aureus TaxID=1280 RepID=UPI001A9172BA